MRYIPIFLLLICMMAVSPAEASNKAAEKFIAGLGNQVVDIIKNKKISTTAKDKKIKALFNKNVDFTWVGNFVLGKHKRTADAAQKKRYISAYKAFVSNSYAKRFKNYSGEEFKILSSRAENSKKYFVASEIIRKKEANVLVDYKLKKRGKSFRIYDIIVEGVSLITTQRAEFNSVINRKGLDYLIDKLENKAKS